MSRHVVIAGTGRTGTTFLVKLFTHLGIDTGFSVKDLSVHESARAGLEINLVKAVSPPYLIKDPLFYQYVDQVLSSDSYSLDCVILPVRDLYAASQSRAHVERLSAVHRFPEGHVPGGFYGSSDREGQEDVLLRGFYSLLFELSKANVPLVLLHFPSLISSCEYLFEKLTPLMANISYSEFEKAFHLLCDPSIVNNFSDNDCFDIHSNSPVIDFSVDYAPKYSAQIFIDSGDGFNELESCRFELSSADNEIEYLFERSKPIKAFRFDPLDSICSIDLESIKIIDKYKKIQDVEVCNDNSCYRKLETYYFNNNDPQIICKVDAEILGVVVKYRYNSFGVETLNNVIDLAIG